MPVAVAPYHGNGAVPFAFTDDQYLYDRFGNQVAIVESVDITHDQLDITNVGDMSHVYIHGRRNIAIRARGLVY